MLRACQIKSPYFKCINMKCILLILLIWVLLLILNSSGSSETLSVGHRFSSSFKVSDSVCQWRLSVQVSSGLNWTPGNYRAHQEQLLSITSQRNMRKRHEFRSFSTHAEVTYRRETEKWSFVHIEWQTSCMHIYLYRCGVIFLVLIGTLFIKTDKIVRRSKIFVSKFCENLWGFVWVKILCIAYLQLTFPLMGTK